MPQPLPLPTTDEICGIVVSYHPDAEVLGYLRNTLTHLRHTVIVDNGSSESCRLTLRQLTGERATLVENPDNEGVGAALNTGIARATELGYRWFLLLDQDTTLFTSTLPNLLRIYADASVTFGEKLALVGSNYYQQCADGSVREAKVRFTPNLLWHEEEFAITAGTLVSLAASRKIGPFRADYFIDHIDHEYCLRARRQGLVVVQTAPPIMTHRIGLQIHRRAWVKLWAKVCLPGYSPLRRYYQTRNFLVLAREYEADFPEVIATLRRHFYKDTKRALFYEGHFWTNLRMISRAVRHARKGLLGRLT